MSKATMPTREEIGILESGQSFTDQGEHYEAMRNMLRRIADAPKHGDDAGDGLRYVLCKVGFGEHYADWLLVPHADGQHVTAAKLAPFTMSILRHQLAAAQRGQDNEEKNLQR